jgi:protoporphyrinogen/coproporphyrinogen III oxidase
VKVAVIGGGIAGLSAAWELATSGAQVCVYEPAHLGGKLLTSDFLGRPVDEGPDALLARVPEGVALCRELGLGPDLVAPAASKALLWSGGKLRPLPDGLVMGAPARMVPLARSGILSVGGMARALGDLVLPRNPVGEDETVFDVVARRFGPEVAAKLVDPLVGSIYAGTTRELSAATATPQLLAAAKAHRSLLVGLRRAAPGGGGSAGGGGGGGGSAGGGGGGGGSAGGGGAGGSSGGSSAGPVFLAPRQGMQAIADRMVERLASPDLGARFLSTEVTSLRPDEPGVVVLPGEERYDGAVIAAPGYAALPLLEPLVGGSLRGVTELAHPRFASVGIVTLGLRDDDLAVPDGLSGLLVAPGSELLMTACSFGSNKWPHWAGPATVVLRVSVGKAGDHRWDAMDDEDLVERVVEELATVLRSPSRPAPVAGGWRVSRWPDSLPQYPVGHLGAMAGVRATLGRAAATVALAGASFGRVGVPACIASGREAGARVFRALAGLAEPAA